MPLYEYRCDACGRRFEKIQKFSDAPLETCELCGKGPVHKLMSSPAIQFKGSGWYITDYAKKGSATSAEGPSSNGAGKAEKSEKAETKAESKSEKKPDKPAKSESSSGRSKES
jgi:putative FmdB family regulatory protein